MPTITISGPDTVVSGVTYTFTVTISDTPDGPPDFYSTGFQWNSGMNECEVYWGTDTQTNAGLPLIITVPVTISDSGDFYPPTGNIASGSLSVSATFNGVEIDSNEFNVTVTSPSLTLSGPTTLNCAGSGSSGTYIISTNFVPDNPPTVAIMGIQFFSRSDITASSGTNTQWSFTGTGESPGPVMLTASATIATPNDPRATSRTATDELAVTVQSPPTIPPAGP